MIRLNIFKRIVLGVLAVTMGVMASPVSEHGRLSISGFDVVDKNNQPYVLRGMSFFWKIWSNSFYNASVVSTLASTGSTGWGANVIRAAISDFDVATAKNMIDYANTSGIYVIIDNHSHCAHKDPNNAISFFSSVAQYVKQKNYVHVLYEVYNEPVHAENCSVTNPEQGNGTTSWLTIKSYAESVISAIRQYDNGIVIVGTPSFSVGTDDARANPITAYSNIAYTLHFYASQESHAGLRKNLIRAKCNNFPVFISEWGTSEASGDGAFDRSMNDEWMSLVETIGVSWANWSVYNKNETSSALATWAGSNGNWNDGELSASGKYVRNIMKMRNSGGTLASLGLTTKTFNCSDYAGSVVSEFKRTGTVTFGYGFQAEDYLDSSNAKTVSVSEAQKGLAMSPMSTSQESSLTYSFKDAPTEAGYYRIEARLTTNETGYLYYSLNDGAVIDSMKYEPTGSTLTYFKSLLSVPANNGLKIKLYWKGDITIDNIYTGGLEKKDSIAFGVLIVDEQDNHIPQDPSGVIDGSGVQGIGLASIAPKPVSVALQGRSLEISGAAASSVDVMDMQGRLLVKASVVPGATVDLAHLRAGSYVVRVKALGKVFNQRILLK